MPRTTTPLDIRRAPQAPSSLPVVAPNQRPLPFSGNLALAPVVPAPPRPSLRLISGAAGDGPTDLERRATRFVQALVEIASGVRPVNQMSRWTTSTVYDELLGRLTLLGKARTLRGPSRPPRARVVSVHVFQPGQRSAEVSARVAHGERSRAIAVRLDVVEDERGNGRWTCTALAWG